MTEEGIARKLPRMGIVVLIYNGEAVIEKCLEAIFNSDYRGPMELVVVDNASTDKSWEMACKFFGHDFTKPLNNPIDFDLEHLNTNSGWAGGTNYGIAELGGWDLMLLLNDDTEIQPNMISKLVKAYEKVDGDAHIFGCRLLYPSGVCQHGGAFINPTGHTSHQQITGDTDHDWPPVQCDYVTGAAMMIARECWDAVGPFYEGYGMYYEEVEYCVRARKKGYETVCVPSAVAIHHAEQREGRSQYMFHLRYERARLRFVWRNWTFRQLLRWLIDERRWYRKHIKGNRCEHAGAVRKAYTQMWYRAPWIILGRRGK